jgi:hypothetical protein
MAVSQTTFNPIEFDGLTITFNLEGGKVASLSVIRGGNSTKFNRVEQK